MANLSQLAIDSKSEQLSDYRFSQRQGGSYRGGEDSMAFLRILRDEDLDKAKDIMNLIKETQKHTREKYVYIAKVKLDRK
ncbi:hypothetical protein Tco_0869987 [Tanacetum coccineum]